MNINDYLLKPSNKEPHPYNEESLKSESFKSAQILVVGTFPNLKDEAIKWFYGSKYNRFWTLIAKALNGGVSINDKTACINFAEVKKIAFLDLFQEIQRYRNYASDNYILPTKLIDLSEILEKYTNIKSILFTSTWAESIARREYREKLAKKQGKSVDKVSVEGNVFQFENRKVSLVKLPSPSPSNSAPMSEKIKEYNRLFDNHKNNQV